MVHLDFMLNSDATRARMKCRKVRNANRYSTEAWRAAKKFQEAQWEICFDLAVDLAGGFFKKTWGKSFRVTYFQLIKKSTLDC